MLTRTERHEIYDLVFSEMNQEEFDEFYKNFSPEKRAQIHALVTGKNAAEVDALDLEFNTQLAKDAVPINESWYNPVSTIKNLVSFFYYKTPDAFMELEPSKILSTDATDAAPSISADQPSTNLIIPEKSNSPLP